MRYHIRYRNAPTRYKPLKPSLHEGSHTMGALERVLRKTSKHAAAFPLSLTFLCTVRTNLPQSLKCMVSAAISHSSIRRIMPETHPTPRIQVSISLCYVEATVVREKNLSKITMQTQNPLGTGLHLEETPSLTSINNL